MNAPMQQPQMDIPKDEMPIDGQEPIPQDDAQGFGGGEDENQFDSGFDAGVEADEDEDPKKFIQQLTGKLSQALNQYTNENGDDEELSKYVGKMIAKAAAKGLDEKGRKELIKSINTAEEPSDDEMDMPDDDGDEMPEEEPEMQDMGGGEEGGEGLMESKITKRDILKMSKGKKMTNSPFNGKSFIK